MKVRIIKESLSGATIDKKFVEFLGYILGVELGRGQFGLVYSIFDQKTRKEFAIKVVSKSSSGFDRERTNYKNIQDFVEQREFDRTHRKIADLTITDKLVSDYLPKIYLMDEHPKSGDLYIVMEKLIPLSDDEEKEWMGATSAMAWLLRRNPEAKTPSANLYDRIIDTGAPDIEFSNEKARQIVDLIARSPEHPDVRANRQKYEDYIADGSDDDTNTKKYVAFVRSFMNKQKQAKAPVAANENIIDNLDLLWQENETARKTINASIDVIVNAYNDGQSKDISTDPEFMAFILDALYDVIFAQKQPFQYVKGGKVDALHRGYGQTDDIFKIDWEGEGIQKNPLGHKYIPKNPRQRTAISRPSGMKFKQDDQGRNIIPDSLSLKGLIDRLKDTRLGQKYRFNPVMDAVEELAEDWDIQVVDLHNANVMKRANGQVVFVDVGLFSTRTRQAMKSGIFEHTKRKIKVRIT